MIANDCTFYTWFNKSSKYIIIVEQDARLQGPAPGLLRDKTCLRKGGGGGKNDGVQGGVFPFTLVCFGGQGHGAHQN